MFVADYRELKLQRRNRVDCGSFSSRNHEARSNSTTRSSFAGTRAFHHHIATPNAAFIRCLLPAWSSAASRRLPSHRCCECRPFGMLEEIDLSLKAAAPLIYKLRHQPRDGRCRLGPRCRIDQRSPPAHPKTWRNGCGIDCVMVYSFERAKTLVSVAARKPPFHGPVDVASAV